MTCSLSIITATHNNAETIPLCLRSLHDQTEPFEHVIVDGASTDGTLDIIEEHRKCVTRDLLLVTGERQKQDKADLHDLGPQCPVPRVISEPDEGLYDALNKGVIRATGDIVGFLHADDFYAATDVLARVAAVFEDPEVEVCYGDLVYVREVGREGDGESVSGEREMEVTTSLPDYLATSRFSITRYWRSGPFNPRKFYWGWMPPHPTFFVRKSVYEKYGLFNLDLGTAADYELMLRFLVKHHVSCAYLPETLVCMRTGGMSNASLGNRLKANRMDREAWRVNGLKPYPWTIPFKPLRKIPQWWERP